MKTNTSSAEGTRKRVQTDSITEGVGINRLTKNFELALPHIEKAFTVSDREVVEISRTLLYEEGLFLGSSSALNCGGVLKVADMLGPGHTIVTILPDSGVRYLSNLYNDEFLRSRGLLDAANKGRNKYKR